MVVFAMAGEHGDVDVMAVRATIVLVMIMASSDNADCDNDCCSGCDDDRDDRHCMAFVVAIFMS